MSGEALSDMDIYNVQGEVVVNVVKMMDMQIFVESLSC